METNPYSGTRWMQQETVMEFLRSSYDSPRAVTPIMYLCIRLCGRSPIRWRYPIQVLQAKLYL